MAKKGAPPPPLLDAFEGAATPAYLIDGELCLAYANQALADWVDLPPAEIVGRRVEYHSEGELAGEGGLMTGLCPAPAALRGERSRGVISCASREGHLQRRLAEFIPIEAALDGASYSVLVLVEPRDLTPGELANRLQGDAGPDAVHLALQQFRQAARGAAPPPALLGFGPASERLRRQVDAIAASGANALLIGAAADGLADIARHAYYRGNPLETELLLPLDAALLETDALIAPINEAAASAATLTLLIENAHALSPAVQSLLADHLAKSPSLRALATGETLAAFDEPLLSCVGTIVARVPSLGDRLEDLPLLAQWCVERCNAAGGKQVGGLSAEALEHLSLYGWPGGIDQLLAVVREAHARCETALIRPDDLPLAIKQALVGAGLAVGKPTRIVLDAFLGRIERELVTRALDQAAGNKAEAARLLGMTRPRLYRRLTTLGMLDEEESEPETPPTDDDSHADDNS